MRSFINKDTQLCCSFARVAGSRGCKIFNSCFRHLGLNFLYKSFSVKDIEKAIEAVRTLSIRGAAITMPFKVEAVKFVDEVDAIVDRVGALNTIVNDDGILKGHNTDYFAMHELCSQMDDRPIYVLGKGGMAKTTHKVLEEIERGSRHITRENWDEISMLRDSLIINCTPIELKIHSSNSLIDCRIGTDTGDRIGLLQASKQFQLYTGVSFPWNCT